MGCSEHTHMLATLDMTCQYSISVTCCGKLQHQMMHFLYLGSPWAACMHACYIEHVILHILLFVVASHSIRGCISALPRCKHATLNMLCCTSCCLRWQATAPKDASQHVLLFVVTSCSIRGGISGSPGQFIGFRPNSCFSMSKLNMFCL